MASETLDAALRPLAPGPMLQISSDALVVDVAPEAGGRIAQIRCDGVEWLAGYSADNDGAIAWGNYAMVPWVGRIRRGRFSFGGRDYQLPITLGPHAIHGTGFVVPWQVTAQMATQVDLELALPMDERWPFGGIARQRFAVAGRNLRLDVSVTAGDQAMPRPTLGWHPWFLKPEQFDFRPTQYYPRDDDYIATLPLAEPPWSKPWDDCFINTAPPVLHRGRQSLKLVSNCQHWVVFDERSHATVVEPMTGSPDAFNLYPEHVLEPGGTVSATCVMEWSRR